MIALYVILGLLALGLAAWLVTVVIWRLVRGAGRVTGLDEKVDRFLDVDGEGLSAEDRLRFREQHPHGGGA